MDGGGAAPVAEIDLGIEGMTCASCVRRVERALTRVPGVEAAAVNLATEQARVRVRPGAAGFDALAAAVRKAGYEAHAIVPEAPPGSGNRVAQGRETRHLVIAALLSAPLLLGMILHALGLPWMLRGWVQLVLATPVQFWLGARFYVAGWKAVRAGAGNMDLLVALGTSAAWCLSVYELLATGPGMQPALYFESSALIVTFILFGKWMEARAKGQTASAIRALMRLRPATTRVQRDGAEIEVPIAAVRVGDAVVVRPGERFPVDGVVTAGEGGGGPLHAHRGEPAGRGGAGHAGGGRRDLCRRHVGGRNHGCGRGDDAGAHRPAGGGRAGLEGPGAAPGRPGERGVRAGGAGDCAGNLPRLVGGDGRPGARAARCRGGAGDRLPLRARAGDADRDHGGGPASRRGTGS